MKRFILLLCLLDCGQTLAAEVSNNTLPSADVYGAIRKRAHLSSTGKQAGGGAPSSLKSTVSKPMTSTKVDSGSTTADSKREADVTESKATPAAPSTSSSGSSTSTSGSSSNQGNTQTTTQNNPPPSTMSATSGVAGAVIATTVSETSAISSSTNSAIVSAEIFSFTIGCF